MVRYMLHAGLAHMPQQEVYEKHRKNAHRGQGRGLVRRVPDWDPQRPGFDPQQKGNWVWWHTPVMPGLQNQQQRRGGPVVNSVT